MPERYCLVCERGVDTGGAAAPKLCPHCGGETVGTAQWPPAVESDLERIRTTLQRVKDDEPGVTEPHPWALPDGSSAATVERERQARRKEKIVRLEKQVDLYERRLNAAFERQRQARRKVAVRTGART